LRKKLKKKVGEFVSLPLLPKLTIGTPKDYDLNESRKFFLTEARYSLLKKAIEFIFNPELFNGGIGSLWTAWCWEKCNYTSSCIFCLSE
jgi:hypothetical protein